MGGAFYALDDECTHEGGALSDGNIYEGEIECPWHGARFEIRSGKVTLYPAESDVQSYSLRINGEDIEIEM